MFKISLRQSHNLLIENGHRDVGRRDDHGTFAWQALPTSGLIIMSTVRRVASSTLSSSIAANICKYDAQTVLVVNLFKSWSSSTRISVLMRKTVFIFIHPHTSICWWFRNALWQTDINWKHCHVLRLVYRWWKCAILAENSRWGWQLRQFCIPNWVVNFGIALKITLQWFPVDEHVKGQGWMNMVFKMTPVDPPAPFDRVDEDITEKNRVSFILPEP